MTNAQADNSSGENITPPQRQTAKNLANAADTRLQIPASLPETAKKNTEITSLCTTIKNSDKSKTPIGSCKQSIWVSFFFDGTGNNLDADFNLIKHSNVAKLYRVHMGDENTGGVVKKIDDGSVGVHRIYIPGLGTYFAAIGDDGMGWQNRAGGAVGRYGDERLTWALAQFDQILEKAVKLATNPKNAIEEINISAFGFSRGAALARAFIHDFCKNRCNSGNDGGKWVLKKGGYPIRIRFMGLFDTVASVGSPMSGNTVKILDAYDGDRFIHRKNRIESYPETMPAFIAFSPKGMPGADPAPGTSNGHVGWGDRMMIPDMVEDVRHFVAAHENRNSFPLDSIQILEKNGTWRRRSNFFEYVYAGVHSDLGGSYKPGEGGKNEDPATKFGLIPLLDMFEFAQKAGVPLLPMSAWSKQNADFLIKNKVRKDYKKYLENIKPASFTVGSLFNEHMRLYYEWRFHVVKNKIKNKDRSEANRIILNKDKFEAERKPLQQELGIEKEKLTAIEEKLKKAEIAKNSAKNGFYVKSPKQDAIFKSLDDEVDKLEDQRKVAHDNWSKVFAKIKALPEMEGLQIIEDFYDYQLLEDAKAIFSTMTSSLRLRRFDTVFDTLRPHYKILVTAYYNEFILNNGLKNEEIISFFQEYIHDSLSGFAKDASFRSDPRVIYVGHDSKLAYADVQPDGASGFIDSMA